MNDTKSEVVKEANDDDDVDDDDDDETKQYSKQLNSETIGQVTQKYKW